MRFVDEVDIHVRGGDGGNGCVSFRREKFVPRGGPDGGDGGKGGDLVLQATNAKQTLLDFHFQRHFRAARGAHGRGKQQAGKGGTDLILLLPVGTQVRDGDSGEILHDLTSDGDRYVVARGGEGGKGNMHFATPSRQAPRFAQKGRAGEERHVRLELKLLAEVGLIGFPNAGKSTLISKISAARPKIADYPFTTLVPNLGVVSLPEGRSLVVADIPGLIEGAHKGSGLGLRFLRHVERTRVLVHLIDASAATVPRAVVERYHTVNHELGQYSTELLAKPQIVVLTKIDLLSPKTLIADVGTAFKELGILVHAISAVTGDGIQDLVWEMARRVEQQREPSDPEEWGPRGEGDTVIMTSSEVTKADGTVKSSSCKAGES
jgi:GTP-binding protein